MRAEGSWYRRGLSFLPVIFLTVMGAVMCLATLGDKPLESDEATSFFIARLDWARFWESLASSEVNGSSFYTALRFWSELGSSEFFLRLLPVFFAVLTAPVLYRVATRMLGPVYGTAAAILPLVNWMFITNAQNLRSYSLSALMATVTTLLFFKLVERPSWIIVVAYALSGGVMLYAHFFGAWVLLAHVLSLLFLPRSLIPWRWLIVAYPAIGLLAVPIGVFVLTQDQGQVDWIHDLSTGQVRGTMDDFTGEGGFLLMGISGILCLLAIVGLVRRKLNERGTTTDGEATPPISWYWALTLLWLILPVLGTLGISFFKPLFQARYMLVGFPALMLCLMLGLSVLSWKPLVIAAWVGVVAVCAAQLPDWYSIDDERTWALKTSFVTEQGQRDDGIIFYAPTIIRPFGYYGGYYAERDDPALPEVIYPGKYWLGYSRTRFNPPVGRILARAQTFDRVWLVMGAASDKPRRRERNKILEGLRGTCEDTELLSLGVFVFNGCKS